MKTVFALYVTLAGFLFIPSLGFFFTGHKKEKVLTPVEKTKTDSVKISKFLIEMADARLAAIEESRLAVERGTTEEIRAYGRMMLIEQAKMLEELKAIAAERGVELPVAVSKRKAKSLDTLKQKTGRNFDLKFIRMIKAVQKRDIILCKRIKNVNNESINRFVTEHRPTTELNLLRLKQLRKDY